jgi:glycyl-tRNA synthetase beta chain
MADFLLELRSEEIPARMQAGARNDLARLFAEELEKAGLTTEGIETFSTPRRLALIARGLPHQTDARSEEIRGPRSSAPPQAIDGFLRKTGLAREQLQERDGVLFAQLDTPGQPTRDLLGPMVERIVRGFPWPKSMRWGSGNLRWVRPLHGIVAILGEEIVPVEIDGISSGATTLGHRFHHSGPITIGGAADYAEKLRACHVIVDQAERERIIREGAAKAASDAGLTLVEDEGLVVENAGLTEWPVPLLGRFDPEFLDVPPEVIQLTARVNQKYFVCTSPPPQGEGDRSPEASGGGGHLRHAARATSPGGGGALAPAFVCVANIDSKDGGTAIVEGNRRVLAARLSDARFFWQQDLKVPLEEQAKKLSGIVFHEKLGTVADKVERVAKLARWLVEEVIVASRHSRESGNPAVSQGSGTRASAGVTKEELAHLAERAARLAKADLVTGMVGEFPELQGLIGGYLARAQGEPDAVADAIRDHYKPVGQGDEVPTAPMTVAVALADKLDSLLGFSSVGEKPTGSRDPYALRRAALGALSIILNNELRFSITDVPMLALDGNAARQIIKDYYEFAERAVAEGRMEATAVKAVDPDEPDEQLVKTVRNLWGERQGFAEPVRAFIADRLKVQQREAGVRHDLIDAVFALGNEDDLVRLLARVNALQHFVETQEGADLLTAYKRAANILKKEKWEAPAVMSSPAEQGIPQTGEEDPLVLVEEPGLKEAVADLTHHAAGEHAANLEPQEQALIAALDAAEPRASAAVEAEDFTGAMEALASLRGPIDSFFEQVTVNDPDQSKRTRRLNLLARFRDAVHRVADFSKIEG